MAEAELILTGRGEVDLESLALGVAGEASPPGPGKPNRLAFPRAYFHYLRFRGLLIDEVPGWWEQIFRERSGWVGLILVGLLLSAGGWSRASRRLQTLFWCGWCGALSLISGMYLYQSVIGEVYWALPLLGGAAMGGVFVGTCAQDERLFPGWRGVAVAVPVFLFPLWRVWVVLPGICLLPLLMGLLGLGGMATGFTFARIAGPGKEATSAGGVLYAVDLLGSAGGIFVGGVLLVWWHGFVEAAFLSTGAALLALGWDRRR